MKRLLFLVMCILLIGAPMANAEIINVNAVRTVFDANPAYDQVVLTITGFTGSDFTGGQNCVGLLSGTWTCTGGFNLLGTSSNWSTKLLNDADAQDTAAPQSWIDFSTKMPDAVSRTGVAGAWTSFTVGTSCTPSNTNGFALGPVDVSPGGTPDDGDGFGFDNTLLGVFYIKHTDTSWVPGATIFSGTAAYGRQPSGGGAIAGIASTVQINAIPEPSTLALLGCGLFGLLAYAWRKRK